MPFGTIGHTASQCYNFAMRKQSANARLLENELAATRPFFWILLLVIVFLYAISLYADPTLREPARLLPFTGLMGLHAALHWFVLPRLSRTSHILIYLAVQVTVVLILSFMTRQEGIVFGLFAALAGETVGIVETWQRALLTITAYLILIVLTFGLIWNWTAVYAWLPAMAIMLLFVMVYVVLYLRQLNAREESQRLLEELQTAHRQLGEYAQKIERLTLTTERQRMARELHDTLAQGLAGLVLQLEAVEGHLEKGNTAQVAQIAGQAKQRARDALAASRRAIDDLRRTEVPATEAIEDEVARFRRATGIPCQLTLPDALPLSAENAEHLVRCVSEGLANCALHARATAVSVTIEVENGRVAVTVQDDGAGFDPEAVAGGHYGLLGLRERARLAGGQLTVRSKAGLGTTIQMQLPIAKESV
jgi:NarL family two-component system sensor histidine kinase YdfH